MLPINLAFLASGAGTTAEYVHAKCQRGGEFYGYVNPVLLIVSNENAGVIKRLLDAGFQGRGYLCDPRKLGYKFGPSLRQIMLKHDIDWYLQTGWMPETPPEILSYCLYGLNQHPAPVPLLPRGMTATGLCAVALDFANRAQRQIWWESSATMVNEGYGHGPVIASTPVEVNPEETVESFQARLLPLEWKNLENAIRRIVNNDGDPPEPITSNFTLLPGEEKLLEQSIRLANERHPMG